MTETRISREEIALRLLCAYVQAGKLVGPEEIKQAFALALTFEEHSEKVGMRSHRERGSSYRRSLDDE